ncbi:MAG: GNAT family N-acetyltransferase [Alistipes indistinctus]
MTPDHRVAHLRSAGRGDRPVRPRPLQPARAGVGILIYDKNDQKRGFASEAVSLLIRYCFQILGLNQLYCNIPAGNIASQALFKSKGFRVIGLKKSGSKPHRTGRTNICSS